MVKADLTQDYYGDLELQPGADVNDIKKQFKKLALKYHPDRNPGRESEVNSKFQTIQAAHEVLTDPEQRARYDSGRRVGGGGSTRPAYGGYKPAPRGNPYASAGAQWAPPPKPHGTPRANPPSAGANRYTNFKPPPTASSARKTAPNGASNAWEQMKTGASSKVRPDGPKSGRAESNSTRHAPPPTSTKPGRNEFRAGETPGTRPAPPPIPKRPNGFAPGSFVGDEPAAANTSAYNTSGFKDRTAPPLPPKTAPYPPQFGKEPRVRTPYSGSGGEKTDPFDGANLSRSNSMRDGSQRGGSSGSNRPTSSSPTRGSRNQESRPDANHVGSPPKRTRSHANFSPSSGGRPSSGTNNSAKHNSVPHSYRTPNTQADTSSEDDSDDDGMINRPFGNRKIAKPRVRSFKSSNTASETNDGPSAGPKTNDTHGSEAQQETGPNMYAKSNLYSSNRHRNTSTPLFPISEASEISPIKKHDSSYTKQHNKTSSEAIQHLFPHINIKETPKNNSPTSPHCLNTFEMGMFNVVDHIVNRSGSNSSRNILGLSRGQEAGAVEFLSIGDVYRGRSVRREFDSSVPDGRFEYQNYAVQSTSDSGSPRQRHHCNGARVPPVTSTDAGVDARSFLQTNKQHAQSANKYPHSFSFQVENETFSSTIPPPASAFTNVSTENISTTFSPNDWHGKFGSEAGEDYFTNDQGQRYRTPSRAQSTGSKSRGRSPAKSQSQSRPQSGSSINAPDAPNIDPNFAAKFSSSYEPPMESPGGTKFSAEEWKQTFKPQTFAPPISTSPFGNRSSLKKTRLTAGFVKPPVVSRTAGSKAAMVESPETSDEENVYKGRTSQTSSHKDNRGATATSAAAEPMDIDSPAGERPDPLAHNEAAAEQPRNVRVEPSREEWRAGDAGATSSLPVHDDVPRKTSPALPPRPNLESKPTPQPEVHNDDDDFADLKDLENIEPLHNTAKGLDSFGDLSSTLPFPSQASSRTIFATNIKTDTLELPNPPKAPQVPSTPVGGRPTQSSWQSYLVSFKAYMVEWDIFNTAMLSHFVARKQQVDNMPANWLESRDDQWIAIYRKGCKEDVRVREWYNVACERHMDAMQDFARFRFSMKDREEKEAAFGNGLRKSTV